jgi:hypothetical protein
MAQIFTVIIFDDQYYEAQKLPSRRPCAMPRSDHPVTYAANAVKLEMDRKPSLHHTRYSCRTKVATFHGPIPINNQIYRDRKRLLLEPI